VLLCSDGDDQYCQLMAHAYIVSSLFIEARRRCTPCVCVCVCVWVTGRGLEAWRRVALFSLTIVTHIVLRRDQVVASLGVSPPHLVFNTTANVYISYHLKS
jgi:hypothetical protein